MRHNEKQHLQRIVSGACVSVLLASIGAVTGCAAHSGPTNATGVTTDTSGTDNSNGAASTQSQDLDEGQAVRREDAIEDHWDEIKDDLEGSATVEACSSESGNCYDLDADIDNGAITEIHFNNGGNLDFDADIDSDGTASDTDESGNDWDFTLDMTAPIVDEAVSVWASENGYTIQR